MTNPAIIGIAGGSGSSKTTLANALVDRCNDRALVVSHDRYYRYMPCGNYDLPEALDTGLMTAHLKQLRSDQPSELPAYDMICNSRKFLERESRTSDLLERSYSSHYSQVFLLVLTNE